MFRNMKKIINESQLRQIVAESVKRVLNELDWKTYMNAARKRKEQEKLARNHSDKTFGKQHIIRNGDRASDKLADYAKDTFQKKYGKNGKNYQYTHDKVTDGKDKYWNGDKADKIRYTRYGIGKPGLNYGYLSDNEHTEAINHREGWTGTQDRNSDWVYDKEGEHYLPHNSSIGNEVSTSKDENYRNAMKDMADDMKSYYTGKSKYIKGKGWTNGNED